MAEGSLPPNVRFSEDGPTGKGPVGIATEQPLRASVGEPLPLAVWVDDLASRRDPVPLTTTWSKYTGPGEVTLEPALVRRSTDPTASTSATFSAPGEYIVRARVDNHAQRDSAPGEQCCWTNAYFKVVVGER